MLTDSSIKRGDTGRGTAKGIWQKRSLESLA
jgi:hypothetical protein